VLRPEPGALALGLETSLGVIERLAGTDAKPIVRLGGIGDRTAIEALRGQSLVAAMQLEEGEWLGQELVGLAVTDGDAEVGVVSRVIAYPSCEVLEVGNRLIPLIEDAVREVDLDAGRIDVDLGFVDGD
jgi:16S rRNA processing protein RimM